MLIGKKSLFKCLCENLLFLPIDRQITLHVLEDENLNCDDLSCFIAYLFTCLRQGHLGFEILDETIIPSPLQLFQRSECINTSLSISEVSELLQGLEQALIRSATTLPESIVQNCSQLDMTCPIVRDGTYFCFQRYWIYQLLFAKNLDRLSAKSSSLVVDMQAVQKDIDKLLNNENLVKKQAEAILSVCKGGVTFLSGGPGTGKTYTAGNTVALFLKHTKALRKNTHIDVAIAAPTGKAASQLQKSLSSVIEDLPDAYHLEALTLHQLLGVQPGAVSSPYTWRPKLGADLLIIDEASMIDIRLFTQLFASIKDGARVLVIGDYHQLPSVEAGSVFSELIACSKDDKSIHCNAVVLDKCLRIRSKEILRFSQLINQGESQAALHYARNCERERGITCVYTESYGDFAYEILKVAHKELFPLLRNELTLSLFESINNHMRFLCPLRKGRWGVEGINQLLMIEYFKTLSLGDTFIVPILVTRNDSRLGLYNGDLGYLVGVFSDSLANVSLQSLMLTPGIMAVFAPKHSQNTLRQFRATLIPQFELGACLTVHKSQGSAFDHIAFAVGPSADCFGREMVYTAVTRAKERLTLLGSETALSFSIRQKMSCVNNLKNILISSYS